MSELIISLDNLSKDYALQLAQEAHGRVWGFKVNDLLLHYGAEIVYELRAYGKVMADPKLFDIPNTIHNSIQCLKTAGANIITIHSAANYIPKDNEPDMLAGIACLTSMPDDYCQYLYGYDRTQMIGKLFALNHYKYLVCSVTDLHPTLSEHPDQKIICPGIRPRWYQDAADDQLKVATPAEAVVAGADYIVVGRPLTRSEDFSGALERTLAELESFDVEA